MQKCTHLKRSVYETSTVLRFMTVKTKYLLCVRVPGHFCIQHKTFRIPKRRTSFYLASLSCLTVHNETRLKFSATEILSERKEEKNQEETAEVEIEMVRLRQYDTAAISLFSGNLLKKSSTFVGIVFLTYERRMAKA